METLVYSDEISKEAQRHLHALTSESIWGRQSEPSDLVLVETEHSDSLPD